VRKPSLTLLLASSLAGASAALAITGSRNPLPRWMWCSLAVGGTAVAANEVTGKPVPFLRWSGLRMFLGMKHLLREWQVGDGREEALAEYLIKHARAGDVDDAIRVIDEFCYRKSVLINIGDEKGEILDRSVQRTQPRRLLELGTYCGYSALRMTRAMPSDAHLWSIEFNPANAAIARRIWQHAGISDRVTVIVGTLGDGGHTLRNLSEREGFFPKSVDLVFLDHAKDEYLPDLERILDQRWLHPGSVVVADNIRFPGVPDYLDYMRKREGIDWNTTEHATHVEYQSVIPDLVLESEHL
jgi:catechol O-methyltransferase